MSNIQQVEINGVKFEIKLDNAKKIETFQKGSRVKLLKKIYGGTFVSCPGIIVGFDDFKNLPTIIIMYLDEYSHEISFEYMNNQSKDVELCAMVDDEAAKSKDFAEKKLLEKIKEAEKELQLAKDHLNYFMATYETLEDFERENKNSDHPR